MATIYAKLRDQYKVIYRILFQASFYKVDGEDQRSDETDLFFILNINNNLTEFNIKRREV